MSIADPKEIAEGVRTGCNYADPGLLVDRAIMFGGACMRLVGVERGS